MKITKTQNGNSLYFALEGRLDTNTAPELEAAIKGSIDGAEELTIDMEALDYLSSAGLRVLLGTQKIMNKNRGHDQRLHFHVANDPVILITNLVQRLRRFIRCKGCKQGF